MFDKSEGLALCLQLVGCNMPADARRRTPADIKILAHTGHTTGKKQHQMLAPYDCASFIFSNFVQCFLMKFNNVSAGEIWNKVQRGPNRPKRT